MEKLDYVGNILFSSYKNLKFCDLKHNSLCKTTHCKLVRNLDFWLTHKYDDGDVIVIIRLAMVLSLNFSMLCKSNIFFDLFWNTTKEINEISKMNKQPWIHSSS